jgi:protein required for attachment to host cells
METTWILVAHRSGAQVYEKRNKKELNLLQEIPYTEGRLKDSELATDRPGRSLERMGHGRHAVGDDRQKRATAAETETMRFIRELAAILDDGRAQRRYTKLVLVAEPRFLGELRAAVSPETNSMISTTQGKDLALMDQQAIKKYLQDTTWPPPRAQY